MTKTGAAMQPTRIGIIGAGRGGEALVRALSAMPEVFLVAGICDINTHAPGMQTAAMLGVPTYADVRSLLRHAEVDWLFNVSGTTLEQRLLVGSSLGDVKVFDGNVADLVWRIIVDFSETLQSGGALARCTPRDRHGLCQLAKRIVDDVAAASQQFQNDLAWLAFHDPLTGLFSRRFLMECLQQNISSLLRNGPSVALVMSDLDHFKLVNDRFGHDAGDTILKAHATDLRTVLRKADLAARYGGEEFAIVLPRTSYEKAIAIAERLRARCEKNISRPDGSSQTLSLGVAVLEPSSGRFSGEFTPEALATLRFDFIKLADAMLYQAKALGRNRVIGTRAVIAPNGALDITSSMAKAPRARKPSAAKRVAEPVS